MPTFILGGGKIFIDGEDWGETPEARLEPVFQTEDTKVPVDLGSTKVMRLKDEIVRSSDVFLYFSIDDLPLERWMTFLMAQPKKCSLEFRSDPLKGIRLKISGSVILTPNGTVDLVSDDYIQMTFKARFRQVGENFITIAEI